MGEGAAEANLRGAGAGGDGSRWEISPDFGVEEDEEARCTQQLQALRRRLEHHQQALLGGMFSDSLVSLVFNCLVLVVLHLKFAS